MQTTNIVHTSLNPRKLTLNRGQFTLTHDRGGSQIGLFQANDAVFAVSTSLIGVSPNPEMFFAGGRPGPAIVSWCPGSPAPTGTFNPGCLGPSTTALGAEFRR